MIDKADIEKKLSGCMNVNREESHEKDYFVQI